MSRRLPIALGVLLNIAAYPCATGWVWGAGEDAESRDSVSPVTLKGMVLNNVHTGEKADSVFVYALGGSPEVKAEFERIIGEHYPEKGLDGAAARKLLDQFTQRLNYFIDGPLAEKLQKDATYGARQVMAVTGVIREQDGKKWITVSKCEPPQFHYPARMLAPDKPFMMPDKEPLILKINDQLSLKCIWVPPGRFLMGEPYYMCPQWQEARGSLTARTRGTLSTSRPRTGAWPTRAANTANSARAMPGTRSARSSTSTATPAPRRDIQASSGSAWSWRSRRTRTAKRKESA